jgi:hypothetical protein
MKPAIGSLSTAVFLTLLLAVTASGLETPGVPASESRNRVPMRTLFDGHGPIKTVRTAEFSLAEVNDGSKRARGRDSSGKPWTVSLPAPVSGLWVSEVRGVRTYYFAGYTGGAGMAPDTWILVISFDVNGRPVPFYFTTYSGYDSDGIKDALDLDGTGPELLQQSWSGIDSKAGTRSGFYITTLYQRRGSYWYRADGRHGSATFPLCEKWTDLPDAKPQLVAAPPEVRQRRVDLSNDPASGVRTKIVSLDDSGVRTGPEIDCVVESAGLVVMDSPSMQAIEVVSTSFPGTMLPRLARAQLAVTLTGVSHRRRGVCGVSAIWVSSE